MPRSEDILTGGTYDQSATADNATATCTLAATARKRYCITGLAATYSAAPTAAAKVLTLSWTEGGSAKTLVLNALMAALIDKVIAIPTITSDPNTAVTLTLTASGTGGVLGRAGIFYTPIGG